MIQIIVYLLLIAGLMGLAAHFGERLCVELGWPRRMAWMAALAASAIVPALTFYYDATPSTATAVLTLPPLLDQIPAIGARIGREAVASAGASSFVWPNWRRFDLLLSGLWIASSGGLVLLYLAAALRVRRIAARSESLAVDDRTVLVSDRLGPAVLGFRRPRVVLPRWLAVQNTPLRAQVLTHEHEHIAARDPLMLLAALLLVALMPWNLALWWKLRRLRAASEVDCDRRVLRGGVNAADYSRALLTVGQRSLRAPFAAVALTEPVSELERRIQLMLANARAFSLAGFGARSAAVVCVLGLALAVNAPQAQQAAGSDAPGSARKAVPVIRASLYDRLVAAQACIDADDRDCVFDALNELRALPDLNTYESAQVQNFQAFARYNFDDPEGAIAAYQAILALPQDELPNGLISTAMRSLAVLQVETDRLQDGLASYDRWLSLPFVEASGNDYYVKAAILYQLDRYPAAIEAVERAIASADEPRKGWYELLFALQWNTDDSEAAARTRALIDSRWPDDADDDTAGADALTQAAAGSVALGARDGEFLPIEPVAPVYPRRAAARGLEGYVVVSFTVTDTGRTRDVQVVESSAPEFDNAAIEAARKYKYRPRIVDGKAVEVPGVTSRMVFELADND